jgi:uncharacterized oligopeptide transporter (OPT) family protein
MDSPTPDQIKPYVAATDNSVKEFTVRAVVIGALFGIIFGAATVYLALKAGLTVSASIPIAVLAISLGRRFLGTTILENNIIQTTGSAGESIAAGVVFTLPAFLFLTDPAVGDQYFKYTTILILAVFGGILGTLMMIPLRRSLIVKEHHNLPYPEGTACASVLIAGEKGGDFARTAYQGLGVAFLYAFLQKVFHVVTETPTYMTKLTNKYFPAATINGEITPEYLGVGFIIGPKISGVLVAGGVLAWLGLIPLLATLVPSEVIATQLIKLGYLADLNTAGGPGGWNPETHSFGNIATALYRAYIRQIGAGAVAAGGFMTLIKTLPTIVSSFQESVESFKNRASSGSRLRTEQDLSIAVVAGGSLALVLLMAILPQIPGNSILGKLFIGILVIVFGFFFVTVSSRIVGLIGTSSNPVSGMTIATLMGTALLFIAFGMTGRIFEPMVLVVGSMICIAAATAGATSQDLKTGYLVGATPKYQQMALFVGAIVSSIAIGGTLQILDIPTTKMAAEGIKHAIGSDYYPAPQGTLMATLIKGLLSFNLDWQFVIVGAILSITVELCGVKSLSFAVGAYLPLSTTLPIWIGGVVRAAADQVAKKRGQTAEEEDLSKGSLFATGLVAGGALMGVVVALLSVNPGISDFLATLNLEEALTHILGAGGFQILGVIAFAAMAFILYRVALKK